MGCKRVACLMRLGRYSRGKPALGIHRHHPPRSEQRTAPDLVKRQFVADGPNRLWVADMIYIPACSGFIFLAIMLDVWSRRIVG